MRGHDGEGDLTTVAAAKSKIEDDLEVFEKDRIRRAIIEALDKKALGLIASERHGGGGNAVVG